TSKAHVASMIGFVTNKISIPLRKFEKIKIVTDNNIKTPMGMKSDWIANNAKAKTKPIMIL
ncbi:MAG TPA: hypothetical protein PKO16_02510, partial [Bacteroidia bacterium]|nr:hypothetical protein [Bacteroidia bacterium]